MTVFCTCVQYSTCVQNRLLPAWVGGAEKGGVGLLGGADPDGKLGDSFYDSLCGSLDTAYLGGRLHPDVEP